MKQQFIAWAWRHHRWLVFGAILFNLEAGASIGTGLNLICAGVLIGVLLMDPPREDYSANWDRTYWETDDPDYYSCDNPEHDGLCACLSDGSKTLANKESEKESK